MTWSTVEWYSLGFNIVDKQCYFYYALEGENVAHQIFVTAPELTALADMFRHDGPITYNSDGNYFVSNQEQVAAADVVAERPADGHHID